MASPFFDPCGFPMFLGGKPPEPPSALASAHAASLNERVWSLTKELSVVGAPAAPEAAKAKTNIDKDSLELYISGLNLKSIQAPLNPNLKYLNCSDNQLTYLPVLPPTLVHLNCSGNNLTSLPKLPDTLILLDCRNNPNLRMTSIPSSVKVLYYTPTEDDEEKVTEKPHVPWRTVQDLSSTNKDETLDYIRSLWT